MLKIVYTSAWLFAPNGLPIRAPSALFSCASSSCSLSSSASSSCWLSFLSSAIGLSFLRLSWLWCRSDPNPWNFLLSFLIGLDVGGSSSRAMLPVDHSYTSSFRDPTCFDGRSGQAIADGLVFDFIKKGVHPAQVCGFFVSEFVGKRLEEIINY